LGQTGCDPSDPELLAQPLAQIAAVASTSMRWSVSRWHRIIVGVVT
jgi:hypothetical protein